MPSHDPDGTGKGGGCERLIRLGEGVAGAEVQQRLLDVVGKALGLRSREDFAQALRPNEDVHDGFEGGEGSHGDPFSAAIRGASAVVRAARKCSGVSSPASGRFRPDGPLQPFADQ